MAIFGKPGLTCSNHRKQTVYL